MTIVDPRLIIFLCVCAALGVAALVVALTAFILMKRK